MKHYNRCYGVIV